MDGAFSFGFILLLIWTSLPVMITEIVHWEMSRQCGSTIGRDYLFGEVTFHPDTTSRHTVNNSCVVFIKPMKFSLSRTNGIVVYFTEFDLGDDCKRDRLTMYDANDKNLVKYSRAGMCGRNYTLTDGSTVFIVKHGTLILNYTWTSGNFDTNDDDFQPAFALKFNSFYEYKSIHECRGSDRHPCVASKCVPAETNCKPQFKNGCGHTTPGWCDDIIDFKEPDFLTTVGAVLIAIVAIAIGYGTCQCLRNGNSILRKACGHTEVRSTTRDDVSTPCTNVHINDSNVQETELITDHNRSERSDSPSGSNVHRDEYNSPSNTLSSDLPPSYDVLETLPRLSSNCTIGRRSPPLPPPSYHEFQARAGILTEYNSAERPDSPGRSSGYRDEFALLATVLPSVPPPPYDGRGSPPCFSTEFNLEEQSNSFMRSTEQGDEYNEHTSNSCSDALSSTPPPSYYVSGRNSQCIHTEV